jgi:hypothetical protein
LLPDGGHAADHRAHRPHRQEDKPSEVVRSQLLKLNSEHISYVRECLQKNTTKVRNIRSYLLTALYNAPLSLTTTTPPRSCTMSMALRHEFERRSSECRAITRFTKRKGGPSFIFPIAAW